MLTTLIRPLPTCTTWGRMRRPSVVSSRPFTPSMRGTLKPQMSASSTPTEKPRAASAEARLTVTLLLPTPPLPLAMATMRVLSGTSVSGALLEAWRRARCMTMLRWAWSISPNFTFTSVTPGRPRTLDCTSSRI